MNKKEVNEEYGNIIIQIQREEGVCQRTAVTFYPQLKLILDDILYTKSDEEYIIAKRIWVDTIARMKQCDKFLRSYVRKDI